MPRSDLVDRTSELRELRGLAERAGPSLALLYGRRRVGKTYLLDRVWDDRHAFYYLAADSTPDINRRGLIDDFARWKGIELHAGDYPGWRTVFRLLVGHATDEPLIVILDEFQYLLGGDDDIVSQLVAVWDREVGSRNLTLVLSGSEVSTLEGLESGGGPLYGRINWSHRLRPFDYWDTGAMHPARSNREKAYLYGILGGTPRFLAAVAEDEPLRERLIEILLRPQGEVYLQLENLIYQERGIRSPGEYQAVLEAVARGQTETDRIASATGLVDKQHVVRRVLETLERLDLVRRERNFDAGARGPWQNRVADNAVRFWYRFVHPNRSRLVHGKAEEVWASLVEPQLDTYMGKVFELIVEEGYRRLHGQWNLPPTTEWARWEGQDRNRRSIEIDIAARLDDGRMLTGEIKWSSRPVDVDVKKDLMRDLEDLSRSGQGWAREALENQAQYLFVSAAGFTDRFQDEASDSDTIHLVDLDQLYQD